MFVNNSTLHAHENVSVIVSYCVWLISLHQMVKMSTGHMEGDLQPLYLLLTDCYIYLLRKGEWAALGAHGWWD